MRLVWEKARFYLYSLFRRGKKVIFWLWSLIDVRTNKAAEDQRLFLLHNSFRRWPNIKQWQRLPCLLTNKEKILIKRSLLILITALIFLILVFYWHHSRLTPKNGGSYSEALVGAPQYINPVFSWANDVDRDLISLIFNSLVRPSSSGEYVGDLAESFTVNKEKTIYVFNLRKNIYWHDGQRLTSDDVLFTYNAILDSEWRSPLIGQLASVRLEKIDENTLQFTFKEPTTSALAILSFGIIPEHLWASVSGASAVLNELNKKPVGTGPFVFDSLTKDKKGNILSMTLVRNENYYKTKPYLDKITFKFYGDIETAASALANKNVQGLGSIFLLNKDVQTTINKNKELVFYSLSLPQYVGVFFNINKNEALKSQDVRRALAYATDRKAILQTAVGDKGTLIDGPVLPGYLGYSNEQKKYNYDTVAAADLLERAGWKKDGNDYRKKGNVELTLKLTTSDNPEYQSTAQQIKEAWQKIGVKTEIITVSKTRFKQDVIDSRAYEALLFSVVSNNNDLASAWHSRYMSDRGSALSVLPNRNIDTLLDEARTATDQNIVVRDYISLQNIIADTVPAIFLYNPLRLYPVSQKIQGLTTKRVNMPSDRFKDIENWFTKTKRTFFWTKEKN